MSELIARGVAGGYGNESIVRDVDISVTAGECVALLGPNGAGKSTLVRLLAGVLPARAGTIELAGRPLTSWRRREIARLVGYVPQLVAFSFPLTVREIVEQGRAPHLGPWRPPSPADHAAVDAALEHVGMTSRVNEPIQHLSGGERQLVVLARALAGEPRILLLDEPATALDLRHQLDLLEILAALVQHGVGVLLVAHDWNLALRIATRIVVLNRGSIAAAGKPGDIVCPELLRRVFGVEVDALVHHGTQLLVPRVTPPPR